MKRKVNLVGQNTLTVSLPTKWTKRMNIGKGDEIDIEEENGTLIIRKESTIKKGKTIDLNLSGKDFITNAISRYYKIGYHIINFRLEDPALLKEVKLGVNNCIGADIIDWEEKTGTIKIFDDSEEISSQRYLIKLFQTVHCTINQLKEDLIQKKPDEEIIQEYRRNAWKLRDYINRKSGMTYKPMEEVLAINLTTHFVEKITSRIATLYRDYKDFSQSEHTIAISKLNKILGYLDQIQNITSKKEFTSEEETKLRKKIRLDEKELINVDIKTKNEDPSIIAAVYFITHLTEGTISSMILMRNIWK